MYITSRPARSSRDRGLICSPTGELDHLHHRAVGVGGGDEYDVEDLRAEMHQALDAEGLVAFAEVDVVTDFERGAIDVIQANGIAGMHSNTVMFGWSEKEDRLIAQLPLMRAVARAGKSTLIARLNWRHEPGQQKRIDLWWGGLENNGDMMLLYAYLLRLNNEWRDARLVVRTVAKSHDERKWMAKGLTELIPETRIKAESEIILRKPGESVADVIHAQSADTDVVFLGSKSHRRVPRRSTRRGFGS